MLVPLSQLRVHVYEINLKLTKTYLETRYTARQQDVCVIASFIRRRYRGISRKAIESRQSTELQTNWKWKWNYSLWTLSCQSLCFSISVSVHSHGRDWGFSCGKYVIFLGVFHFLPCHWEAVGAYCENKVYSHATYT